MNHSRFAAQRGVVALMAVLFLLFMLLVVLVIANQMATTDVHDSSTQNMSVEALFLAESGLETGGYRYRSGTACNSPGFDLTQPLGSGSFALTAATYKPAATTLTAGLTAASSIVPVASTAGFAPHGRIAIANEEINYAGLSSDAASCAPGAAPCFTGATRGVVGSPTPATHPAGTAVNQNQCLIRSVGATNIAQRTLEAATTVKNVQSGSVTMNPSLSNVALTAVDMGRTFVLCNNRTDDGDDPDQRVTCELTSATNLQIRSEDSDSDNIVQWHVVEFTSGVAVQRGVENISSGTGTRTVTISAVNQAKSFVLISERIDEGNTNRDERWTFSARLSNPTTLELRRNETGRAVTVAWQVIQMQDATVQSGLTTINNNSTTATATIGAVDVTRTFLVFSRRAENSINGREGRYQVRGELTNATTLTFTRAGDSDDVDIAWFAVTLNDGTTVQRGTTTLANNNDTANVALASAIVPNRSFPIISVSGGLDNNSGHLDDTSITADLTSTTNLRLERDSNADSGNATVAWFVVNLGSPRIDWQEIIP
jgi:hypothetical protein